MWIKQALVIVPIALLLFLAISVFWVPRTEAAANDPSRLNRLVWSMGATPEDMNPYHYSTASDGEIISHLAEALLHSNEMYEIEPWMARYSAIHHEAKLLVPASVDDEALGTALRAYYGDDSVTLEPAEWELKTSDAWTKAIQDPALAATREFAEGARMMKVRIEAPRKDGEITNIVDPAIAENISKHLDGGLRHDALDAAKLIDALEETGRTALATSVGASDADQLKDALAKLLTDAGLTPVAHNPVFEFQIHEGISWVDGPFFGPVSRTWWVSVNGDEVGHYRAESAEAAKEIVKQRLRLDDSADLKAWNFTDTFGDTENGPWWGRGPDLTSRDVKRTLDLVRSRDFASLRISSWMDVRDTRTFDDDPYRVEVVYRHLFSPAIFNHTSWFLPYHHWNKLAWTAEAVRRGLGPWRIGVTLEEYNPVRDLHVRTRSYSRRPSSIGPMVLYPLNGDTDPLWENGRLVRLMRNEFYWNRKPSYEYIDYYVFNPRMGEETAEMVFNTGGVDLYGVQPHQVQRYRRLGDGRGLLDNDEDKITGASEDYRYTVIQRRRLGYDYIGFNMEREPVNDIRVRIALNMALNIEDLIKYIYWGQAERIAGPSSIIQPWYNHDYRFRHTWRTGENKGRALEHEYVPHDLDEARALLEEAGYDFSTGVPVKDGQALRLNIDFNAGNTIRRDIAVMAQQEWEKLGIRVTIREHEWNVYIQQYIRPRNFTICVLGWAEGLSFDRRGLWHSDSVPPFGQNFVSYKNDEADALIEELHTIYDFETQKAKSDRLFGLIADELPYIFLASGITTTVVDPRVVWQPEAGVDKFRPLTHTDIRNARASFTYWMYELTRLPERPQWTAEDYDN